jgi:hypothetical protein
MSERKVIPVDWKSLFDGSISETEYFIPGIAPMGAVTYIYSGAKIGKSLFVLNAALNVSQGKPFLGQPCVKRRVAYLDFENNLELHIKPRIVKMGLDLEPERLSNLVYFSRQWFDDFDSFEGGQQLLELMEDNACAAIIIDTSMRRVKGANDSFDTFNNCYRFTLERLAAAGYAVVLIEHPGKTGSRGITGSSQKSAIADCVWGYEKISGTYRLTLDVSRHPVSEDVIEFALYKNPLRYALLKPKMSKLDICIEYLDSIDAPFEVSQNAIARILRGGGYSIKNDLLGKLMETRNMRRQEVTADIQKLQMYEECFGDDIFEDYPDHEWEWPSEN